MNNVGMYVRKEESSYWREWLRENGSRLLLFARQQTRRPEDAEDVLQEALVKLARKVEERSFVGGQKAWMPFLYTQIRREAIDLGRRNDRRKRREDIVVEDRALQDGPDEDWFECAGYDDERRVLLEAALKGLPGKFSEVILMKIWGGQTFAEIGDILEISMNTVASRYRYGIDALKKKLSGARFRGDL